MNDYSFYSIDRLVEFGMGMAMAQQMVRGMNEAMQKMYVPGSINNLSAPQCPPIYVAIADKATGPLSEKEFSALVQEKAVNCNTLCWLPGQTGWKPIDQCPQLLKIIAMAPPPLPSDPQNQQQ